MLGHKSQCCHLVGDKGTCPCLHHGGLEVFFISDHHLKTITDANESYFPHFTVVSDQLCSLHWNNYNPCPEIAVSRYRRKWIQHLPVSIESSFDDSFESISAQFVKIASSSRELMAHAVWLTGAWLAPLFCWSLSLVSTILCLPLRQRTSVNERGSCLNWVWALSRYLTSNCFMYTDLSHYTCLLKQEYLRNESEVLTSWTF